MVRRLHREGDKKSLHDGNHLNEKGITWWEDYIVRKIYDKETMQRKDYIMGVMGPIDEKVIWWEDLMKKLNDKKILIFIKLFDFTLFS